MTTDPKQINQITRMNFEVYTPVSTREKADRLGWLNYGDRNDFPNYLVEIKQSSPVHGSLVRSIADMVAGKGDQSGTFTPEMIGKISNDLITQGGFYLEVIYTIDGTNISKVNHLPFCNVRLSVNEYLEIDGVWYSRDWSQYKKKGFEPRFIDLFNTGAPEKSRQCIICFEPTDGVEKYPKPDYWGAINHIETARQIGLYHANSFLNGLFPSFIINMRNGIPDPDEQNQIIMDWEGKLSGAKNTGKFIITFNNPGSDNSPEITSFPMTEANTSYLELSYRQCTEQIFIAHRVTTPRIFGVADSGNGLSSNTDEMLVGLNIFNAQVIEPKRRMIETTLNKITEFNSEPEVKITSNEIVLKPGEAVGAQAEEGVDVAATALNGAQIASLVEIIIQASTAIIPIESAKAIITASFPTLTQQQVDDIFTGVVPRSVNPAEIALRAMRIVMNKNKSELDKFIEQGEATPAGYILIDSFEVTDDDDDHTDKLRSLHFTSTGTARPNSRSEQDERIDDKLFITRYRYRGELKTDTREFCRKMLSSDKLYRKEDILQMENKAVNPGWGPEGANTYNIWFYKGGGNCHHFWQKEVYVSAEGAGIDVENPNAQGIAVRKAQAAGYVVKNEKLVAQLPVDMPNNGFLPTNPIYGNS